VLSKLLYFIEEVLTEESVRLQEKEKNTTK
jgi:hypothetical protein